MTFCVRVGASIALAFAAAGLGVGCANDLDGTPAPDNVFYFPIGLRISAGGGFAYVSSSNFDLRFNSGWLSVVDLERAVALASGTGDRAIDSREPDVIANELRVPSLGGTIAGFDDDSLLYIAHRSDRLISVIEVADALTRPEPSCGVRNEDGLTIDERRTDCDRAHLFAIEPEDAEDVSEVDSELDTNDVDDPYGLQVVEIATEFGTRPYLVSSQLSRFRVNTLEISRESPFLRFGQVEDGNNNVNGSQFDFDNDGLFGRSEELASTGRLNDLVLMPGVDRPFLAAVGFAGSGDGNRASVLHLELDSFVARDRLFSSLFLPGTEVGGTEFADVVFAPDGRFAFGATRINNRTSQDSARGSVIRLDTRLETVEFTDDLGERDSLLRPRYEVDAQTALRGQPSGAVYLERPEGDILAISDLDQDSIFFLDPRSAEMPVIGRVDVPGGPFSLVGTTLSTGPVLVATLFYEHGLAVVDVSGDDASDFRVSARIENRVLEPADRAR